jgi:hypothetical protein
MDTAIIAAIVGGAITGIFGIVYIVINFFLQKKDKKEKPQEKIRIEGDAAVGDQSRLAKQTGNGTYIEQQIVITPTRYS